MDDVTELYCLMDDFCKDFEPLLRRRQLQAGKRVRRQVACLSLAELMPLLVLFHHIRYRQFKAFDLKLRIKWHKVFAGMAARGKSSPGWFFGFKLHIVIKHLGELLAIKLKAGKVDDRKALASMTGNWFGKLFADKGYIEPAPVEHTS